VGLAQGILLVAADKALGVVFQPGLAIALVLLVLVLTNGGFHLDGLADTFDALASKSTGDASKDMEKKLSIMRDGTAGPIGVTTIVFSLGLKYLALVDISGFSSSACYFSLFLMPMMSKWTMVASMYLGRPARQDGLGRLFVSGTGCRELAVSTVILLIVMAMTEIVGDTRAAAPLYLFYAGILTLFYLLSRVWVRYFKREFGGLTGDTLGAVSEVTEISFLFMVIIWSRLSI
jgi:adenosylcobinamide-GDP ribazoletransferase